MSPASFSGHRTRPYFAFNMTLRTENTMTNKHSPLLTLAVSACFGMAVSHTATAQDIETLVGQIESFAGPNVTLMIDTSGSMTADVFIPGGEPYDSNRDYTGPFDLYENFGVPSRLFYTLTPSTSIDYLDEGDVNSNQWVTPAAFLCANGQPQLLSSGLYTDRFAQFRVEFEAAFWDFPSPTDGAPGSSQDLPTECRSDFGIHGDGSGSGSYPVNYLQLPDDSSNLNPWTGSENDPDVINWDNTGATYTFFTPNFLNWIYERKQTDEPAVLSRLEIVQDVSKELIQILKARSLANNDGLRLGLMRFDSNGSGGRVLVPTDSVVTNDVTLVEKIDDLGASGNTPLAETMYEAYLYYTGSAPEFGGNGDPGAFDDSGNYESPIIGACQRNFVILLTDGQPNGDFQADTQISNLAGECNVLTDNCLDEMTNYMSTADLAPDTGFTGDQTVDTFTIGFFADFELLEDATTAEIDTDGDDIPDTPGYFLANDRDELREAFENIFSTAGIAGEVATFTAPAVSVNTLNRLTNRDTLYFTLYEPSASGQAHWDGNLKAYKIGRTSADGDIQILDANGAPAVDQNGLFFESATSLWGTEADGPNVAEGGVAGRLSAQRNIYSNLTGDDDINLAAADDVNRITRENADAIGAAIGGMFQDDELLSLIDFIGGVNEDGSARQILGDPLHSQPLVINFDGSADDQLLIFGTNDGFLHFIDPTQSAGSVGDLEYFAFIPKALLSQQPKLKANLPSPQPIANKVYGMDGPITAWIQGGENDRDELVVNSGDTLWIYAGMRRGGRAYYGFDVTNRNAPRLEFTIDNSKPGYGNLGQTWSSASYASIELNGVEKNVIIFGGGYDPNQDTSNTPDSMGNSVYIADATNGDLLWSAGPDSSFDLTLPDMTHSIPSNVRIIDTNGDGSIDRLYVGDTGAQVWRFDIDVEASTFAEAVSGGKIADFSGDGASNERRFYSAPSVSRYVEDGIGFLAIGMGSGYRAHPLDQDIDDRFYVIRDENVYRPLEDDNGTPIYGDVPGTPSRLIQEEDLLELTLNSNGEAPIQAGQFGDGWFLDLNANAGEKSLSSAVTAEGRIFFTTYSPDNPALTCDPVAATGLGRFYGIDILSGLPALFDDPVTGEAVLSVELGPTGIPPQPRLVFVAPNCEGCDIDSADDGLLVVPNTADIIAQVGTQAFDVGLGARPVRTYWVEF